MSIGIALAGKDIKPEKNGNDYFIGSLGLGASDFRFHDTQSQESELFVEIGAEYGFRLTSNILAGAGFNYKHYGSLGETKARWLDLYLSASVAF